MKQALQVGKMQWRGTGAACFLSLCLLQLSAEARASVAADPSDSAAALDLTCPPPGRQIEIPDGATSSEAELLRAKAAVLDCDTATTAYTKCLADAETRMVALQPGLAAQLRELRADRNDAAVGRAEQVVTLFNQALQAYRAYVHEIRGPVLQWPTGPNLEPCYRHFGEHSRASIEVFLKISETGEVTDMQLDPGGNPRDRSIASCVVEKASIIPGTMDKKPVSGTMKLRLYIQIGYAHFGQPKTVQSPDLLSSPEEATLAHDECSPADLHDGGVVKLAMSVLWNGRVVSPYVTASSGVRDVDRAAICIAKKLRYSHPLIDGRPRQVDGVEVMIRVRPRANTDVQV
ncbi:MAG: hypothetical protein EXR87_00200 [Gammaproteobacteria bacterium]|nr:hypothetical protein [Gammaproteobacteria bacterium]